MVSDILIIDDEADIRDIVSGILSDEGHGTRTAADADSALAEIGKRRPSLVFLDIWLQGSRMDGLAVLDEIKRDHAELPVVMISGHGNIETAVSAIKRGAYDYIEKPFKSDRLVLVAERALEASMLRKEVHALRERAGDGPELIGRSAAMNHVRQLVEKIGPTNSRVMISGPSGSGKELVARAIHRLSGRAGGPFIVLNAATITPERMEEALFGAESLNGAGRRIGALEEAHGGTLYLDEVGDMPRETQNKILRVLVDQSFQRVGGSTKATVDVRIVSSTARDLEREIGEGEFREDLFIGWPWSRCGFRRSPSGAKTFPSWSATSWRSSPAPPACRSAKSATTPWRCCRPTTGRETFASSAIMWKDCSFLPAGTPPRQSRRKCCRPKSARCCRRRRAGQGEST